MVEHGVRAKGHARWFISPCHSLPQLMAGITARRPENKFPERLARSPEPLRDNQGKSRNGCDLSPTFCMASISEPLLGEIWCRWLAALLLLLQPSFNRKRAAHAHYLLSLSFVCQCGHIRVPEICIVLEKLHPLLQKLATSVRRTGRGRRADQSDMSGLAVTR